MMNKKNSVFLFLLGLILVLFVALYLLGIFNYFEVRFIEEFDWLDFNSKRISLIYLVFLTIFLVLTVAIMMRLILSFKEEKLELTGMNIDDFSIKNENPENNGGSFDKIMNSLNKNLMAIQKFTDIIDVDAEKIDKAKLDDILKDKIDMLYLDISHMLNDIIMSANISELFEKILFWSVSFSGSKRGSIMVVDKNKELYIYKTIGWNKDENIKNIRIPLGDGIAGKVAAENKRIFVTNIENYEDYDFKYKNNYQTKSFISMPIYGIKKVVAVLNLTENKNGLYSMNELEVINVITKLATKIFELIQVKKKIF